MKLIGNVIIVDDSITQLMVLEMILKDEGLFIKSFSDGFDTIEYLKSTESDLSTVVITDMNMPGMNGMELTEKISNEFDKRKIAVVALTEFGDTFTLKEVFDRGATDFISKPAKKIEILPRVRNILKALDNARELKEKEQRLSDILNNVRTGIVIIDADSHKIVDVNPMTEQMIGLKKDQIIGNICHKFICSAEQGKCPITDLHNQVENQESILMTSDGKELPILKTVNLTKIAGREHLIESFVNITEMKRLQEELRDLSIKDPLTGLYNRRHFYERTRIDFQRSLRTNRSLSFMMIDLDNFKKVNDTYGHQAGDEVLISFARIAEDALRQYDILCRFGGEEFAILCPESTIENTKVIAERIRKRIEENIVLFDDMKINFTVSIGISCLSKEDKNIEFLIKRADDALYKAKKSGKNRVEKN